MTTTQILSPADQLVGQFRTFGALGPVYEVLRVSPQNKNGKQTVHIKVLTSGEEVDYPVEQALADPEAR